MPLCRAGELTQLWKQAELADVEDQALEIMMIFESFDDFWDHSWQGLSPDLRVEVRDRIERILPEDSTAGTFELTARAWATRGILP